MFKGRTVLITGGTGYLGAELCRRFARYGAKVVFTYNRGEKAAKALVKELGAKSLKVNLRDVDDITAKIEGLPRVDVLVNNAGATAVMPLALLEEEDVDLLLDVNVKGMIFATKAAVRGMLRRKKGGVVINMGSLAGERMMDVPATYAASKAAAGGFTVALAAELKRYHIRVNCVVPGLMEGGVAKNVPAEHRRHFEEHCAAGRSGKAIDVAETVCFLASDKASYIIGQKIFVDGGV